jgi:hypothetical protein
VYRVVVWGSRTFSDYILSGGARGADRLAEQYACDHGLGVERFPADWARYGRAAGPQRNEEMIATADALVAFWDGTSPGTRHAITTARRRGLLPRTRRAGSPRRDGTRRHAIGSGDRGRPWRPSRELPCPHATCASEVISVATAIQCAQCGFMYGFTNEEIRYIGFVCPSCKTAAPRVEVEVDLPDPQAAVDYLRRPATAGTQPVEPERVPALIDALDVRLALWIAQSMLSSKGHPACGQMERGSARVARHRARHWRPRRQGRTGSTDRRCRSGRDRSCVRWIQSSAFSTPASKRGFRLPCKSV